MPKMTEIIFHLTTMKGIRLFLDERQMKYFREVRTDKTHDSYLFDYGEGESFSQVIINKANITYIEIDRVKSK